MQEGIQVRRGLVIPRSELRFRATRSGGPGGQHVNTSSTRIELVWCVRDSAVLSAAQRRRLEDRLASRLDAGGCLRVVSEAHRSQLRNRDDAERRLGELVRKGLVVRRKRIATRPPAAARERRLTEKKKRGERKRTRGRVRDDD
jgi:ribosome-associated protein